MPSRAITYLWFALLIASLAGCGISDLEFGNIKTPDYTPTLAIPLAEAHYTMRELVKDLDNGEISIEEDSSFFLTIVYVDSSTNEDNDSFLFFSSSSQSSSVFPSLFARESDQMRELEFENTYTFSFDLLSDERIDSIFFNAGDIQLELNSRFRSDLLLSFTFPTLVDQVTGEPLTFDDTLSFSTSVPVSSQQTKSMGGKKLALQYADSSNNFDVSIKGKIIVNPGQSVNFSDFFRFSFRFESPTYSHVHGYFGTKEVALQDRSIELDFFKRFGDNGLLFKDPKIRLLLTNSFGFPSALLLDSMSASNGDGTEVMLAGQVVETSHFINHPSPDSVGTKKSTEVVINTENSNVKELFEITPVSFNLPLTTVSNPLDFDKAETNFMTDSSRYTTTTIIELPFEVKMEELLTTLDFSVSEINLDNFESATLRIFSTNEMPFDGRMLIQFADTRDSVFYTSVEEIIFKGSELDEFGRTTEPTEVLSEIILGPEGTAALKQADQLKVVVTLNTFNASQDEYVKVYADYQLDVNISILGSLNISTQ